MNGGAAYEAEEETTREKKSTAAEAARRKTTQVPSIINSNSAMNVGVERPPINRRNPKDEIEIIPF